MSYSGTSCLFYLIRFTQKRPNNDSDNRTSSCSKTKTVLFGFDVHKLVLDGKEKCFEECRAKRKYYKIVKFVRKNLKNTQKHQPMDSKNRKPNDSKNLKRKGCSDDVRNQN